MSIALLLMACTTQKVQIGDDTAVNVGGDGTPAFTIDPSTLDMGVVFAGSLGEATATVNNTGDTDLSLSFSIASDKADAWTASLSDTAPAKGASSILAINLQAVEWGAYRATVTVTDVSGTTALLAVSAQVEEDLDGDGHGSLASGGDDCDEADVDIHGGATEIWYDGIDQNCDGADDYDQDGDGNYPFEWGGTDCDDTNADVYPGAPETWYDGIDADCAGDDDYDQDKDGQESSAYGGIDCDDTNIDIRVGAVEVWYDGVDQNCDGADDYDQDGDGFTSIDYGGTDCSDTDASTYPGAPEIWYDNVDQGCDGGDDFDQDGDGTPYPTDCSDTDPTTIGPTPEVWDGLDNDCDGTADDFTVTDATLGAVYGSTQNLQLGGAGTLSLGGDLTGDGTDDVVVGAQSGYGSAWVLNGSSMVVANGAVENYDTATVAGDYYLYSIGLVQGPQSDVSGDGNADLLLTGTYSSRGYGISYLYDGGSTFSGSFSAYANSDASYTGDSESDYDRVAVSGDIDGDGVSEVITGMAWDAYYSGNTYYTYAGIVAVFDGDNGNYDLGDSVDWINGANEYDYLGYSVSVQDLNNDGYADILSGAPGNDDGASGAGAFYLFAGNSTMTWADDLADSAASLIVTGTSRSGQLGIDPLYTQADGDNNGSMDLTLSSSIVGSVWWWSGGGSATGTVDVSSATATITGTANSFASSVAWSDFDGNGNPDLLVGDPSNDTAGVDAGLVRVFSGRAWSGAMTDANASGTLYGAAAGDNFGKSLAGGYDLNGDGLQDVLAGATGSDLAASNGGAVYLLSKP